MAKSQTFKSGAKVKVKGSSRTAMFVVKGGGKKSGVFLHPEAKPDKNASLYGPYLAEDLESAK